MRLLRPLRDVPIALLWGGLATSAVGDQLYAVVLSWIAVAVFGAAAGYLTALQAAIVLMTALGSGRWADRRAHRSVMIGADLSCAAVLLSCDVARVVGGWPSGRLEPTVLAVLVLAVGQALLYFVRHCEGDAARAGCRPHAATGDQRAAGTRPTGSPGWWGRAWCGVARLVAAAGAFPDARRRDVPGLRRRRSGLIDGR